jgi:ribosome-associated protein
VHKLSHYLEDQAKREQDDRDLTSRSDLRKERKQSEQAHADLARALCDCTKKQFERLVLGDALHQVVTQARKIDSPSAKDRALRLVRRELRAGDADSVRQQLDALNGPKTPAAQGEPEQWLQRMVTEGDNALATFALAYPLADRQRLRQLLIRTRKANGATLLKANAALLRCIAESLDNAPAPVEPTTPAADPI